jgi:DNA-binding FadR family transcriptional regulator
MSNLILTHNGDYGKTTSKCDMVAELVLMRILNDEYKTGERLPAENQLCEEFGVSRATIREAFKKLNMLNVISIHQGDGTFVEKLDAGILFRPLFSTLLLEKVNVEQIYDARIWLEVAAISMALKNKKPEDIRILRDIIRDMDEAVEVEDSVRYSALDNKLHMHIFKMADNLVLISVYEMMRDIIKLYRKKSLKTVPQMKISHKRHQAMLTAIEDGDDNVAIEMMRRHIEICKAQMLETLGVRENSENNDDGDSP